MGKCNAGCDQQVSKHTVHHNLLCSRMQKLLNEVPVPHNCKLKIPEQILSTLSSTDRSIILYVCSQNERRVCDVNIICNILTRKPAVVAGVTVVSIKLCGDWSGFTHQQEDKAHSCHFSTWGRFSHCHIQKVNIALTTFLGYVVKKGHLSENELF